MQDKNNKNTCQFHELSDVRAGQTGIKLFWSQDGKRGTGVRKDHFLCECEGWLRHLFFNTSGISPLANICIHFGQDRNQVNIPGEQNNANERSHINKNAPILQSKFS